jgi:outer membrane protein TolC
LRYTTLTLLSLASVRLLAAVPSPPSAPPLTVEEAVAIALRVNPLPRAAAREVDAVRAGVGAARALANPSVTVSPGIFGPAGADEELSINQPLELSGTRRKRTRIAEAELRAARSQAVVAVRDLVRDVKLAYYDLARAQEIAALQAESVTIAAEFERIARRQVELGARPGIDLAQLQVELTRSRQLELQAAAGVRLAAATLNTRMGRAPDTLIVSVTRLTFAPLPAAGIRSSEEALQRRAEVLGQEAQLDALRRRGDLIRAEGRPDLAISIRLESFTTQPRAGGIGLEITLPILDYGGRRERRRRAERVVEAQSARVEAARNDVRRDVEAASIRVRTTEQLARQYEEGLLGQARRLAESERTRFQTGAGSPLNVLEAQRTYRSVLGDYCGALAAHEEAKAVLEWALGSVQPPAEVAQPERPAFGRTELR